ncbi:MAG: hypothetical protein M1404_02175 [Acidobacteria bacterium]|nr:hypothetical protein [Acidobacteriota bacterium]
MSILGFAFFYVVMFSVAVCIRRYRPGGFFRWRRGIGFETYCANLGLALPLPFVAGYQRIDRRVWRYP